MTIDDYTGHFNSAVGSIFLLGGGGGGLKFSDTARANHGLAQGGRI